ncbi:MAG: flagellar hook-associated protein FlgK [Bacillota bacterium]|nr:flagellar hook-associated protein FlgK [Bacillota bacterium]
MRSTFLGLETARRALVAHQRALEVIGHNIANAGTPGYVRREPILAATPGYVVETGAGFKRPGTVGTGVEMVRIKRVFDGFLENRIRQAGVTLGLWEGRDDALSQVEAVFGEPSDTGLADALNKFFAAWEELSKRPESIAARTALVEEAKTLASYFNQVVRGLRELAGDLDEGVATRVDEVNSLAREIAAQNKEIVRITAIGNDPADLKDKRDVAIARLSRLVNMSAFETRDGSVVIRVGSGELVRGDRVNELRFESGTLPGELLDPGVEEQESRVVWANDGNLADIGGGEVGGLLQVRNADIAAYYRDIEQLVTTLADEVNQLHESGYGIDTSSTHGIKFFEYDAGRRVLEVNLALDPDAGGDVAKVAASATEGVVGDGSVALTIAGLEDALTMGGDKVSFSGFYQQVIADIGTNARQAAHMVQVHEATLHQYTNNKDSISGVAIDEEMVNLMRYQRAYEAAARLTTAVDEMLDTLINGTGLVGR